MSQFFDDADVFRRELQTRPRPSGRCWSCSARGALMSFNVHKDFAGLDIPAEGCPERVWLCPACAVEYMNSFNRRGDRKKGKEESTSQEWTVERLLEFLKTAG